MRGFSLIAKGNIIELFMETVEEQQQWIDALKKYVILLDLKDELIVGDVLGQGNFAKVNLCERKSDNPKKFALKTLRKQALYKSKRNIQYLLTEIDILRKIEHPNVIKLEETYETSKFIHLLLPYLSGGELYERIKNNGLYRESDAKPLMHNFVSALEYLHSKNIVHRDLKPENLMLKSKDDI